MVKIMFISNILNIYKLTKLLYVCTFRKLIAEKNTIAELFRTVLSKPQYQYFVTVLLGLMLCEGAQMFSGLLQQIVDCPSLAGLSRFLSEGLWEEAAVVESWWKHFREEMKPKVAAELERVRQMQPKRASRSKEPVVTGISLGMTRAWHKRKGKKMEGLGMYHSTTEDKRVRGHSLIESLYVLLGRCCPLAPQLYRQQKVCDVEDLAFQIKITLMETTIRTFEF